MALPGLTVRARARDVEAAGLSGRWRLDVAAIASYVLLGLWVTSGLWLHPSHGIAIAQPDQALFEFMLGHGASVLAHGQNPFRSPMMGAPVGVNMMANTSVLGISLPLAPVTLLFGTRISFNLALLVGLAGTASSWYLLVSRVLIRSRVAAWVCGLICGFGPAMISHANTHLSLVGQILIPVLLWRAIRLCETERWIRNGLLLAFFAIWQYFVSAELLLLTAIAIAVAFAVIAWRQPERRPAWRPFLSSLVLAAAVSLVVLAYPLWVQFRGVGAYRALPPFIPTTGADPLSFVNYSRLSLAGSTALARHLARFPTEENTFFGLPLVVLIVVAVVLLRRRPVVVALAVVAALATVCSFGPQLVVWGHWPGVTLPWRLAQTLPILSSVLPSRWGLVLFVAASLLVALLIAEYAPRGGRARAWLVGGLIVALVPLFPKPLPTVAMQAAPAFIADGAWRTYTAGGRTLMFLPMASHSYPDPIRWAAEQGNQVHLTQGYFLGAGPGGGAIASAPPRTLTTYVGYVRANAAATGTPPHRAQMIGDLTYWHVGAVVLSPDSELAGDYRKAMTRLLGFAPTAIGGVEVWDVRRLTTRYAEARHAHRRHATKP